jgi:hypothetical protein
MNPSNTTTETSFDLAYTWGLAPSAYLSTRQVARLMIFRSKWRDAQYASAPMGSHAGRTIGSRSRAPRRSAGK